jgi:hypothetical protein
MIETPGNVSAPHLSPDGMWEWNGTQWMPAQAPPGPQQVAQSAPFPPPAPPAHTAPPSQTNQVSPDGKHQWNGTTWTPVKKKGHLVRNLGIVAGALLLVGIGGALANSGSSNKSSTATTSTPSPAASVAASAAPAPVVAAVAPPSAKPSVAPAGPKVLLDKTGNGTSKTAIFQTSGEWTITYYFDCTGFGQAGNFQIYVYDGSSGLKDLPVNSLSLKGSDTVNEHNLSGPYYLEMNSECDWHVTVSG